MAYERIKKPASTFVPVQKKATVSAPPGMMGQQQESSVPSGQEQTLSKKPATDDDWLMKSGLFTGQHLLQRLSSPVSESSESELATGLGQVEQSEEEKGQGSETAIPHSLPLQAKLTIGEPGDKYEQEADRVAADVVQRIHAPEMKTAGEGVVQRQEMGEEEEVRLKSQGGSLQRVEISQLNPKSESGNTGEASADLEASIQGARGSGQPLDESVKEPMEREFGADFSGVRVHTDGKSDELNQEIQAKAFTTGEDIFFRQGAYETGSRGGQELLAHELTHVVQQKGTDLTEKNKVSQKEPEQKIQRQLVPYTDGELGTGYYEDSRNPKTLFLKESESESLTGWYRREATFYYYEETTRQYLTKEGYFWDPRSDEKFEYRAISGKYVHVKNCEPYQYENWEYVREEKEEEEEEDKSPAESPEASKKENWKWNGHYWEGYKGLIFINEKGLYNSEWKEIKNASGLVKILKEILPKPVKKKKNALERVGAEIRSSDKRKEQEKKKYAKLETADQIGDLWSPGPQKDGYLNAKSHMLKHARVDSINHSASGFDEQSILKGTAAYVTHAYEFKTRNSDKRFHQKNFTEDGGEAKNVTIYFSYESTSDRATIAVYDQDMGVIRSFYDLEVGKHGYGTNKEWLIANGATL